MSEDWGFRGLEVWGFRALGDKGFRGLGVWGLGVVQGPSSHAGFISSTVALPG